MGIKLKELDILESIGRLKSIDDGKHLFNSINAYSYVVAQSDHTFAEALRKSDFLIPDGMSIVKSYAILEGKKIRRFTGWDLFEYEMNRISTNSSGKRRVMFVGSSNYVLSQIRNRALIDYPNIEIATYSPPFKKEFSNDDNRMIIEAINSCSPDLLWIGMTAPKQEKWIFKNWDKLNINCHVGAIGAVFDFYAGTEKRAPLAWQNCGFEWLYRFLHNPRRLWKRYLIGNLKFVLLIIKEALNNG